MSAYLTPHSDIVAQLVHAHQTQAHNLMTLTNYQTRIALYEQAARNRANGRPERRDLRTRRASGSRSRPNCWCATCCSPTKRRSSDQVQGPRGSREAFQARGPRDRRGRSLRDFDLTHPSLQVPAQLPGLHRVVRCAAGAGEDATCISGCSGAHGRRGQRRVLAAAARPIGRAIFEILLDTKNGTAGGLEDHGATAPATRRRATPQTRRRARKGTGEP